MKLYYSPGACSLASHIALKEIGATFEAIRVDIRAKKTATGADFSAITAKGYVPALELDSGEVLTEGTVVLQYVADLEPALGLAPAAGTMDRYRLMEWLGFVNSEVHKNFSPLFDPTAPEVLKERARAMLAKRLTYVAGELAGRDYLLGAQFTVADAYLYTVLGWTSKVGVDLSPWPVFEAYRARIGARPSVQAAQAAEKAA